MHPTDNSSAEDTEAIATTYVVNFDRQLNDILKQLSPERLKVLTDFAAYLASAESEAATQE